MKFFMPFLMVLSFCSSLQAEALPSCFKAIQKHIKEAIVHNQLMAPIYSELSKGKSEKLSRTLITLEKISSILIKNTERQSKLYQESGIALLCEEIPDMKDLPAFRERLPENLRPNKFFDYDYKKSAQKIETLMDEDRLDKTYEFVANDLRILEEYPNQLCLTRHFLESIARTLLVSSKHREDAKKLGLPDPQDIIKKYINFQRRALTLTKYLDHEAFALQKEGLLIFCQDVPAISWK